ncbi:MAG: hypothetical protein A2046_05150 [Bacteroidetes bacterium GWA2_30_7]|nr:MAG: hypothetical protein A2046_05150 [Bacteroidetes bacterium GWA2_30_7]
MVSFITGDFNSLDVSDMPVRMQAVLAHEYGHYLQSRARGTLPLIWGELNIVSVNDETENDAYGECDVTQRVIDFF